MSLLGTGELTLTLQNNDFVPSLPYFDSKYKSLTCDYRDTYFICTPHLLIFGQPVNLFCSWDSLSCTLSVTVMLERCLSFHFNLLPELSVSQQLFHQGSLSVLLGNAGMIEVDWVVHHSANLHNNTCTHRKFTLKCSTQFDVDYIQQ